MAGGGVLQPAWLPPQSPRGKRGHMGSTTLVEVEDQDVWGRADTKKETKPVS